MSQARLPLALLLLTVAALLLTVAAGPDPVVARPGSWGGSGWSDGFGERSSGSRRSAPNSREGKVQVSRFLAENLDVGTLGHGGIGVSAMPGSTADTRAGATFEAAVVDQLAKAGYDTMSPSKTGGQIAEVSVIHDVVRPEEAKRSPISGETTIGVGTGGSYMGMAINIDATKPAKALVSTRLVARIRDRATDRVLWEGRADIVTRDGDSRWTEQAIATRLAAALFDGFPSKS